MLDYNDWPSTPEERKIYREVTANQWRWPAERNKKRDRLKPGVFWRHVDGYLACVDRLSRNKRTEKEEVVYWCCEESHTREVEDFLDRFEPLLPVVLVQG